MSANGHVLNYFHFFLSYVSVHAMPQMWRFLPSRGQAWQQAPDPLSPPANPKLPFKSIVLVPKIATATEDAEADWSVARDDACLSSQSSRAEAGAL